MMLKTENNSDKRFPGFRLRPAHRERVQGGAGESEGGEWGRGRGQGEAGLVQHEAGARGLHRQPAPRPPTPRPHARQSRGRRSGVITLSVLIKI